MNNKEFIFDVNTNADENLLVIDIETAPDELTELYENYVVGKKIDKRLKDPEKINANIRNIKRNFALNPKTGKITSIGYLTNNEKLLKEKEEIQLDNGTKLYLYNKVDEDEKNILNLFWEIMNLVFMKQYHIISMNGKKFDFPFIYNRSLIKEIYPANPVHGLNELTSMYKLFPHYDLGQFFVDGNLASWAYLTGLTNNLMSSGIDCIQWFHDVNYSMIEIKNKEDLFQTYSIYNKIRSFV